MRKIYNSILIIVSVLLTINIKAQTFPESFEGVVFPPAGWVVLDNGIGTVESWTVTNIAQNGNNSAYISHEAGDGFTVEDWLVSPATLISASTPSLSYWEKENYVLDYGSIYSVLVSTSSQTDVATFTTVATYPESTTDPTNFRNNIIDLTSYAGQTVYIAFKMSNDDGDDWLLDNINLIGACINPPSLGAITGNTFVTNGSVSDYTVSPTSGSLQWYKSSSANGPWIAVPSATATIQPISAQGSGTVYLSIIASEAGCPNDTINMPFEVLVSFPNNTCDAIPLTIGESNMLYDLAGATTETGEVAPSGGGCSTNNTWCSNVLDNSRWFTFVAPSSGYVSVHSPGFDTQLAVWSAASCGDLLNATTATLIAANDDDINYSLHGGVQYSSYLTAGCLTPGATYYIQLDSYGTATANDLTKVIITDLGPLDLSFTGLNPEYCLASPTTSLEPNVNGGVFTINSNTTIVTDFNPALAGLGTHTVTYTLFGCSTTSVTNVSNVCTNIKENQNNITIQMYPNPNNGVVNISIANEFAGSSKFEIYDAIGKLVFTQILNKETTTINTSSLESGIYMVKFINKNQDIKVIKMIKH